MQHVEEKDFDLTAQEADKVHVFSQLSIKLSWPHLDQKFPKPSCYHFL